MTPEENTIHDRPDGARVRVDRIANGQVYYCAWRPGNDTGFLFRTPYSLFCELIDEEKMEVTHDQSKNS